MMKELAYKALHFITGGKGISRSINGYSVKLPTRYINYFPSDYEAANFHFMKRYVKKGDVVLDIGAHIGVFSSAAAIATGDKGKVYAFEPAEKTFHLLQHTIAINRFTDVIQPFLAAIGSYTGKISFYVSDIVGDNSNSLVSYKSDRTLMATEVDIFKIDDFVHQQNITHLKFIKIDVEGAELDAWKGGKKTFLEKTPFVILAIHPEAIAAKGDRLSDIYDAIEELNYVVTLNGVEILKETFCTNADLVDYHLLPLKQK